MPCWLLCSVSIPLAHQHAEQCHCASSVNILVGRDQGAPQYHLIHLIKCEIAAWWRQACRLSGAHCCSVTQVAVQIVAVQQRAAFSGTGPAAWAIGANCTYKASSTAAVQNVTVVNVTSATKYVVQPAKATPTSKQPATITVSQTARACIVPYTFCIAAPCGISCRPCCIASSLPNNSVQPVPAAQHLHSCPSAFGA